MKEYTFVRGDWATVLRIFSEAEHVIHAGPIFVTYYAAKQIH